MTPPDAFGEHDAEVEALISALVPKLDDPIRKAADAMYGIVMEAAQDYLRDNAQYNLSAEITSLKATIAGLREARVADTSLIKKTHDFLMRNDVKRTDEWLAIYGLVDTAVMNRRWL